MVKDLLVINTYGGSLLLASKDLGLPIRGSYEDAGYGSEIQAENFPDVPIIREKKDWPRQDLSRSIVIAHPPCAAFSGLTMGRPDNQGVGTKKFRCTVEVLEYATRNKAAAILVESVVPAMMGAWAEHQRFADKYHLTRILQNARDFGVPQNRPRFWVAYVRKDLADPLWKVDFQPREKTVGEILQKKGGLPYHAIERVFETQKAKILKAGLPEKKFWEVVNSRDDAGAFFNILHRKFFPSEKPLDLKNKYLGGIFMAMVMRILDEKKPATTLLGNGVWVCRGRILSQVEYKRIMGFPDDYVFPGKHLTRATFYLSQGICPPVGTWLLKEMLLRLTKPRAQGLTLYPNEPQDIRSEKLAIGGGKQMELFT